MGGSLHSLTLGRDPRVLLLADNLDDASAEDLEREIAELEAAEKAAAEKLLRANAQPAAAADAPTPKDEVQGSQPTAAADAPTPKDEEQVSQPAAAADAPPPKDEELQGSQPTAAADAPTPKNLAADEAHASDSAEDLDAADDLDSLEAELKSMEADAELVRQKLKAEDKKAKDAARKKQQGEAKVDDAPTVVNPAADVADEAPIKDEAATRMQVQHEAPLQEEREVRAKPERTVGSADSDAVLTRLKSEHAETIAQLRAQIEQAESEAEQRHSILLDEKRGLHEELQTLRESQAAALKEVRSRCKRRSSILNATRNEWARGERGGRGGVMAA